MRLYQHPDLKPLEIWHGQTSFGSLFQIQDDQLGSALSEFLCCLQAGSAKVLHKSDEADLIHAKNFKTVYITGGKAPSVFARLSTLRLPFEIQLVEEMKCLSGYDITLDWGQTSIKSYTRGAKHTLPRDLNKFPIKCSTENRTYKNEDTEKEIKNLFLSLIESANPKTIALALPLKIGPELVAEPSTYEGLEGDLKEIFAETTSAEIEFMNDAVLAARQVRELNDFAPGKTLILTVGYGTGAALWEK